MANLSEQYALALTLRGNLIALGPDFAEAVKPLSAHLVGLEAWSAAHPGGAGPGQRFRLSGAGPQEAGLPLLRAGAELARTATRRYGPTAIKALRSALAKVWTKAQKLRGKYPEAVRKVGKLLTLLGVTAVVLHSEPVTRGIATGFRWGIAGGIVLLVWILTPKAGW